MVSCNVSNRYRVLKINKNMNKQRALGSYYQFMIDTTQGYVKFTDINGKDLPDYKSKLTPAQWQKASYYLTRKLIPFLGYRYEVKEQYKNKLIKIT